MKYEKEVIYIIICTSLISFILGWFFGEYSLKNELLKNFNYSKYSNLIPENLTYISQEKDNDFVRTHK